MVSDLFLAGAGSAQAAARVVRFCADTATAEEGSAQALLAKALELLRDSTAPRRRLELPSDLASDEGILSLLESAIGDAALPGRELTLVVDVDARVSTADLPAARWQRLGALLRLSVSQRRPRELPPTARRLREWSELGLSAFCEAEVSSARMGPWLESLYEMAPVRLRLRLGPDLDWGVGVEELLVLLSERLKREGSAGVEFLNLSESEEPDLLSSALAVDGHGRLRWDSGRRQRRFWPSLDPKAGVAKLLDVKALEPFFLTPEARYLIAKNSIPPAPKRIWLENVSAGLRWHSFWRKAARTTRDASEALAIQREVLGADLPDQDRFLRRHLPQLESAYYQLRSACLYDCVFCRHKGPEPGQSLDSARAFLAANARVGRRSLALVGNEPLLHPHLDEIIRLSRRHGFSEVEISTSGSPLADPARAAALKEAGATAVSLPLHSADAAEHDAITRSPGSFRDAVRAVENLLRLGGVRVFVHANLLRQNLRSVEGLERLVSSWGLPLALMALRPKESGNMHQSFGAMDFSYAELSGSGHGHLVGFPVCVALRARGDRDSQDVSETIKLYSINRTPFKVAACADCPESPRCPGTSREHLALHPRDEALLRPVSAAKPIFR